MNIQHSSFKCNRHSEGLKKIMSVWNNFLWAHFPFPLSSFFFIGEFIYIPKRPCTPYVIRPTFKRHAKNTVSIGYYNKWKDSCLCLFGAIGTPYDWKSQGCIKKGISKSSVSWNYIIITRDRYGERISQIRVSCSWQVKCASQIIIPKWLVGKLVLYQALTSFNWSYIYHILQNVIYLPNSQQWE